MPEEGEREAKRGRTAAMGRQADTVVMGNRVDYRKRSKKKGTMLDYFGIFEHAKRFDRIVLFSVQRRYHGNLYRFFYGKLQHYY